MPTAIVIDLSDPKFEIVDPKTGNLKTLDSMVRDAVGLLLFPNSFLMSFTG
jgi:hypothetical protein